MWVIISPAHGPVRHARRWDSHPVGKTDREAVDLSLVDERLLEGALCCGARRCASKETWKMGAVRGVRAAVPVREAESVQSVGLSHCRRATAIVDTAAELLRPESDLLRMINSIGDVDVLVAADVVPSGSMGPVGVLTAKHRKLVDAGFDPSDDSADSTDPEDDAAEAAAVRREELRAEIAELGVPGLRVHHLGLRNPLQPAHVPDLVAALSELVGFDPEPGLYCLAPAPAPSDVGRSVMTT